MYLNCHIKVTINDIALPYIVSCRTNNDNQHIGSECDIVIPLNSSISYYDNQQKQYLTALPKNLFGTGDKIIVKAKYDGVEYSKISQADENGYITVFTGFLYEFYEGMPLRIHCIDWVYFLQKTIINIAEKEIKLDKLIEKIISGTGITMIPFGQTITKSDGSTETNPLASITMYDISFTRMSPAAALDYLKKEGGFNISLQGDKLYVNVASNITDTVIYDTRYNVINCSLQPTSLVHRVRHSVYQLIKVTAWFFLPNGKKSKVEVGDDSGTHYDLYFYNIKQDNALYLKLANEGLEKFRQKRYSGGIESYLYPYVDLFWRVIYRDYSYPERNGIYVCTAIERTFDEGGFRTKLRLAFLRNE